MGEFAAIAAGTSIHSIILAHLNAINLSIWELFGLRLWLHIIFNIMGLPIIIFLQGAVFIIYLPRLHMRIPILNSMKSYGVQLIFNDLVLATMLPSGQSDVQGLPSHFLSLQLLACHNLTRTGANEKLPKMRAISSPFPCLKKKGNLTLRRIPNSLRHAGQPR